MDEERRAKYKQKGKHFGNTVEQSRTIRIDELNQRRKEARSRKFSNLNLNNVTQSPNSGNSASKIPTRLERLKIYKQQKALKEKLKKIKAKSPFKVGIVHHRAFSPSSCNSGLPGCVYCKSNSCNKSNLEQSTSFVKGITRATEKRLAAKAAAIAALEASNKKPLSPLIEDFKPTKGFHSTPLVMQIKKENTEALNLYLSFNVKNTPRNNQTSNGSSTFLRVSSEVEISKSPITKSFLFISLIVFFVLFAIFSLILIFGRKLYLVNSIK